MSSTMQMKRLAALEARRLPVLVRRAKAERDHAVRAVLADPDQVASIRAHLLGCSGEDAVRARPVIVGLRADT